MSTMNQSELHKGCLVNLSIIICTFKFEDLGSSVLMPVSQKRHLPMAKRLPTSEKFQRFALWEPSVFASILTSILLFLFHLIS